MVCGSLAQKAGMSNGGGTSTACGRYRYLCAYQLLLFCRDEKLSKWH